MATIDVRETYENSPTRQRVRVSLASGETTPWYPVSADGGAVAVKPGVGGQMYVEATSSPLAVVTADNANATSTAIAEKWSSGNVTAAKREAFAYTTAVRFVAIGAAGVGEIAT